MKDRLHKVLMRAARMTINSYCFKKSIDYILGLCKWHDIDEMIKWCSLKFMNNMLTSQKPKSLFNKIKFSKRACRNLSFHYFPKSSMWKNTLLYKGIEYFNKLPNHLKYLPGKTFKAKLKSERYMLKQLSEYVVWLEFVYRARPALLYRESLAN